jgi:ribonuclease HIII
MSALRDALEEAGWTMHPPPAYALWAARGPSANAVAYASGKVVFQGKGAADAAESYLDVRASGGPGTEVKVPTVGCDESGKGDFLGPLVTAAVLVRPGQDLVLRALGVRDSKTMSDREALETARTLREAYPCAVVAIQPPRYNEMHASMGANLNRVLAWAHATAMEEVLSRPDAGDAKTILLDQFEKGGLVRRSRKERAMALAFEERPRAESHPAVAAASVLARAGFLEGLKRLGDDIGVPLAKGGGAPADEAARRVFARGGRELLAKVAKMHFRNAERFR